MVNWYTVRVGVWCELLVSWRWIHRCCVDDAGNEMWFHGKFTMRIEHHVPCGTDYVLPIPIHVKY